MPEGHTIHRLARDLTASLLGKEVRVSSPQGRFVGAARLDGTVMERAYAHGKHPFLSFAEHRVHIHLGLFGRFKKLKKRSAYSSATRLLLETDDDTWSLSGPTACEILDDAGYTELMGRLGADPLANTPRPAATWLKLHRSRRSLGALLLDQSVFAGIGNVYRAELLFLLKLHPETPGNELCKSDFDKMWKLAKELLARGVESNHIITVKSAGRRPSRREALYVCKRKECRVCGDAIARTMNAARMMFHCPSCQPLGIAELPTTDAY